MEAPGGSFLAEVFRGVFFRRDGWVSALRFREERSLLFAAGFDTPAAAGGLPV